jgi:DNA-binding CsgD family transcriptional regulator
MEAHVQDSDKSNDVLASFTVDEYSIRVERATCANRDSSLATFHLNGIHYVLLSNLERSKALTVLTRREREIALQIARGLGTKQIAHNLGISPHTAVTYVNRMRNKLGVRNRPEIVAALLGG